MNAWSVDENGELWNCAYATVQEAMAALAQRVSELANMPEKAKGAEIEWTLRVIRVRIEKPTKAV